MALKLIQQDAQTLRAAFAERKREYDSLATNPILQSNFGFVLENWSMVLRYEGAKSQTEADLVD